VTLRARLRNDTGDPSMSTEILAAVVPTTGPVKRFDWPRKLATEASRSRKLVEHRRGTELLDPPFVHHCDGRPWSWPPPGRGVTKEGEADLLLDHP
jgi:hypothetical protein